MEALKDPLLAEAAAAFLVFGFDPDPEPLWFDYKGEFVWGPFAQVVTYEPREARQHFEPIEDEL